MLILLQPIHNIQRDLYRFYYTLGSLLNYNPDLGGLQPYKHFVFVEYGIPVILFFKLPCIISLHCPGTIESTFQQTVLSLQLRWIYFFTFSVNMAFSRLSWVVGTVCFHFVLSEVLRLIWIKQIFIGNSNFSFAYSALARAVSLYWYARAAVYIMDTYPRVFLCFRQKKSRMAC